MEAYPRTRTWPYLALVLVLFFVAVCFPELWARMGQIGLAPGAGSADAGATSSTANLREKVSFLDGERRVRIDFRPEWLRGRQAAERRRTLAPVPLNAPIAARRTHGELDGFGRDDMSGVTQPDSQRQVPTRLPARFAGRRVTVDPAPGFASSFEDQTAALPNSQPRRAPTDLSLNRPTRVTTIPGAYPSENDSPNVDATAEITSWSDDIAAVNRSHSVEVPRLQRESQLSPSEITEVSDALPVTSPELTPKRPLAEIEIRHAPPEAGPASHASAEPKVWPETTALTDLLDQVQPKSAQVATWLKTIRVNLDRLRASDRLTSTEVTNSLNVLTRVAYDAERLEAFASGDDVINMRRISYAIQRRVDVWRAASEFAKQTQAAFEPVNVSRAYAVLDRVKRHVAKHQFARAWENYLMLDTLFKVSTETWVTDATLRRQASRTVLDRLADPELTSEQREVMSDPVFDEFEGVMNQWAAPDSDASPILYSLEQFERSRASVAAIELAEHMSSLGYSPHAAARELQTALNRHYRNANVRLTVTGNLLNDLLPVLQPIQQRIEDRILGARVRGQNRTWTDLSLSFVEDPTQLRMRIFAAGTTRSQTVSSKGPVRFLMQDRSRFNAGKELVMSPQGVFVSRATAEANNQSQLLGVESDYDQIPLLGWIVRQIALDEHADNRPFLRREVRQRVTRRARNQLDDSIHSKLAGAEQRVESKLLEPLRNLNLDPQSVEMRTTAERMVMRVRLAGTTQLAAYTPRPRAKANNVLSFQLHESAANNILDRLDLAGAEFELEELVDRLSTALKIDRSDIHEQLPEGVEVQLGNERPIQFEFSDDRVLVTIKVQRLKTPRRTYRNFTVRGRYRADVEQTHVNLQRDGGIELAAEKIGFRDQIALRSIFTKVMTRDHRLNLVQGRVKQHAKLRRLGVSQFEVRDGWIGVSIGPMRRDRVALQE